MVNLPLSACAIVPLVAQQGEPSPLEQLDPPRRAAVVMALLGLVILAIGLAACILLGSHWIRRIARSKPPPRKNWGKSNKVRRHVPARHLPDEAPGETAVSDRGTDETVTD